MLWTYKSICIYDDIQINFIALLTNKDFSNEFVKFDIQLIDENGKVFIETFDYTIKKSILLNLESSRTYPELYL